MAPTLAIADRGTAIAFATVASNVIVEENLGKRDVFTAYFPAPVQGDLDGDGAVGPSDLALLLGAWGTSHYDLDGDGAVGASDVAILLGAWTP